MPYNPAMKNTPGLVLGFDFGMKRIGVAVGQTLTKNASPETVIKAKGGVPDWNQIDKIIKKWQPYALVVGIPLNMDGTEQPLTNSARLFANRLHEHFQLPIFEMDERLTSVEARARVFEEGGFKALKKTAIDSLAAQLILENWLAQLTDEEN